jgi:hypothetical protein
MPPNKGMKLTRLSAALVKWKAGTATNGTTGRRCHLVPAPFRLRAVTALQLIPNVRWARGSAGAWRVAR